MTAVVIGYGNTLRHDDAVAARVLELIEAPAGTTRCCTHQLTPELAAKVAAGDLVVFVDAEARAGDVRLRAIDERDDQPTVLAHAATPRGIVAIAQHLFGFRGRAFECSVPVRDLSPGIGLSPQGEASAHVAARALSHFLRCAFP